MRQKYDDLLQKDAEALRHIPAELCDHKTREMFLMPKKNIAARRIREVVQTKTRDQWQLPQLKDQVSKYR